MGKLKVNFTTALFVFSFIICVIVAVVFVDRSPKNDYDSFYDDDRSGESRRDRDASDSAAEWAAKRKATPAESTPAAVAEDPNALDLPIDSHLLGSAQVVGTPTPVAAVPTQNIYQNRSPEEISRMLMQKNIPAAVAAPAMPAMAVPPGIPTPASATPSALAPQRTPAMSLPIQSNNPGVSAPGVGKFPSPGGYGSGSVPSLSNSNSSGNTWSPVSPMSTPSNMIGLRSAPSSAENGMMITEGRSELGAQPPPGFSNEVTKEAPAPTLPISGAGSSTGLQPMDAINSGTPASSQQPYLLQPSPGAGSYNLPPTPTPRPPLISDPDRRRSEAENGTAEDQTPGNASPEGNSDQAVAVSGTPQPSETGDKPVSIAARVNDVELTDDQAVKLATANALTTKKPLTNETRKQQIADAVKQWTTIAAAAEEARAQNLAVTPEELEKYAAMKSDIKFDEWKQTLTEAGFSKEEVQERVTELALSEKLVEHRLNEKYSDKDLEKVYDKTPKEFASPRQVHVLEIYKKLPDDDDEKVKKVEGEMRRLQRQAAGGTDFALLAKQASDARNRKSGGDHGWITLDKNTDKVIAGAVSNLKSGEVSPVIEGEDGLRIYKVIEDKPARDDFAGGKELVVNKLKSELRESAYADARKSQSIELAPKGQLITAKKDKPKDGKESKPDTDSKTESKPAPVQVAEKPQPKPAEQDSNAEPTPQRQTFAAAPANQLLYAPGTQPPAATAGGAPLPASQPGGQTPAPESMTNGYRPGTTIHVGDSASSVMEPVQSTTVNYATNSPPQGDMTPEQRNAAIAREAQAMRAQAESIQNAQDEAVQSQIRRAQAGLRPQPSARQQVDHQPELPGSPVEPAAGVATPQTMQSNGWTVTKTVRESHQPGQQVSTGSNAVEPQIPPGFGGSNDQQQTADGSTEDEPERKGGLVNNVRNFFSRKK